MADKPSPPPIVTLFEPGSVPCRGMRSGVSAASLPPGFFAQLTNVNFDGLDLRVRAGITALVAAGPAVGCVLRGSWHGYVNATERYVVAYDIGGVVKIYSLVPSSSTWTELTEAAGANGNTHLATGLWLTFAVIKDLFGVEILVGGNGTDFPRIIDFGAGTLASHNPVSLNVSGAANVSLRLNGSGYNFKGYDIGRAGWTITNSSPGTFDVAGGVGLYGGTVDFLTVLAAVDGDNTVITSPAAGPNYEDLDQVVFLCNGLGDFSSIQVEIGHAGGAFFTLWDPRVGSNGPTYITSIDPDQITTFAAVFQTVAGSLPAGSAPDTVRLTWRGVTNAATFSIELMSIQLTGGLTQDLSVQGGSTFAYSLFNTASRAESASSIIDIYNMQPATALLGIAVGWLLPNSPDLNFVAEAYIPNASAVDIALGVNAIHMYYQGIGAVDYIYLMQKIVNFYTGTWPVATAGVIQAFILFGYTSANTAILRPDGFSEVIPVGAALLVSSSRFFVGGVNSSQVWISEANQHTRFRSQVRFLAPNVPDESSATVADMPGEIVGVVTELTGKYTAVAPIIVGTQCAVWRIDGFNVNTLSKPSRYASHGMPFVRAYCSHHGILYWLDQELQVLQLSGTVISTLTKNKVDNKFVGASLANATMAVAFDRLYLGYQPAGVGSNTHVLVYETLLKEWCEYVLEAGDAGQLLTIDTFVGRSIYAFAHGGALYQLEAASVNDAGTPIQVGITSKLLHSRFWSIVVGGPVSIACDTSANSLAVTRTWVGQSPDSVGQDGTINLALTTSNIAWLTERGADDGAVGGSGAGFQVTVSGPMPAGAKIYSLHGGFIDSGNPGANLGG